MIEAINNVKGSELSLGANITSTQEIHHVGTLGDKNMVNLTGSNTGNMNLQDGGSNMAFVVSRTENEYGEDNDIHNLNVSEGEMGVKCALGEIISEGYGELDLEEEKETDLDHVPHIDAKTTQNARNKRKEVDMGSDMKFNGDWHLEKRNQININVTISHGKSNVTRSDGSRLRFKRF
jgi:hypothetical protein